MAVVRGGDSFAIDMSDLGFAPLQQGGVSFAVTNVLYVDDTTGGRDAFFGTFTYDAAGAVAGGVLNHVQENLAGFLHFDVSGFSISATAFFRDPASEATWATILSGADTISGTFMDDVLKGYGGNDTINGDRGFDSVDGGAGDDVIVVANLVGKGESTLVGGDGNDSITGGLNADRITGDAGADTLNGGGGGNDSIDGGTGDDLILGGVTSGAGQGYLRGGDGNDSIVGSFNFDDINGNAGNDTARGGDDTDWVVGGQGDDLLYGENGDDIVYGNMGNDTVDGGAGADLLRGGQGADSVVGGAGNDWVTGDLGADTLSGGAGADTFYVFANLQAGADKVIDFSAAEGDRVQLDPGTVYSLSQVGGDTVVSLTIAGQAAGTLTLVGVTLSSLPQGWIFGA